MAERQTVVTVVMGSDSDWPVMRESIALLKELGVPCEARVISAHRTPEAAAAFARDAEENGVMVIIAAAGGAAHLAGVLASMTTLPVIGVPLTGWALDGLDALLATVQMPGGIPVATMAIGKAGARNAALFAGEILALGDKGIAAKVKSLRQEAAEAVTKKDGNVRADSRKM
jgi:phosphoribosylaminoimidazole carboxylase PurE protein